MSHLDHIGIAVTENSRLAELLSILNLPVSSTEDVPAEQVKTIWIPLPKEQGNIELLKPLNSGQGTVAKFLEKTGRDGIHHLSFRVKDITASSKAILAAGFKLIYSEPKSGAHQCLVNFVHPSSTGGVLVEITQKT